MANVFNELVVVVDELEVGCKTGRVLGVLMRLREVDILLPHVRGQALLRTSSRFACEAIALALIFRRRRLGY
jgi:hypothetical protein